MSMHTPQSFVQAVKAAEREQWTGSASPNFERSDTSYMTRAEREDAADAEAEQARAEAYEHHVNDVCRAIQMTPYSLVDSAYLSQVIYTLSCRALDARLETEADELGAVAMDLGARSAS